MKPMILLVTVESPWPILHGGRLRTARVAAQLAQFAEVVVAYPVRAKENEPIPAHALPSGVTLHPFTWAPPSKASRRISGRPHLGLHFMRPVIAQLRELVSSVDPDVIWWSHSYLAAAASSDLHVDAPQLVEFANIESERLLTFSRQGNLIHRGLALVEYVKARRWEPRVASSADLAVAISQSDLKVLSSWSNSTVLAANGIDAKPFMRSPSQGCLLAVANWKYPPNAESIRRFLRREWPAIRRALPWARLELAGSGSASILQAFGQDAGIFAHGFAESLDPLYAAAAAVLAPATGGGGSQLKVTEALGHSRIVLGPEYLSGELREGMPTGAVVPTGDLAEAVISTMSDVRARNTTELAIHEYAALHSWTVEFEHAREAVQTLHAMRMQSVSGRPDGTVPA